MESFKLCKHLKTPRPCGLWSLSAWKKSAKLAAHNQKLLWFWGKLLIEKPEHIENSPIYSLSYCATSYWLKKNILVLLPWCRSSSKTWSQSRAILFINFWPTVFQQAKPNCWILAHLQRAIPNIVGQTKPQEPNQTAEFHRASFKVEPTLPLPHPLGVHLKNTFFSSPIFLFLQKMSLCVLLRSVDQWASGRRSLKPIPGATITIISFATTAISIFFKL